MGRINPLVDLIPSTCAAQAKYWTCKSLPRIDLQDNPLEDWCGNQMRIFRIYPDVMAGPSLKVQDALRKALVNLQNSEEISAEELEWVRKHALRTITEFSVSKLETKLEAEGSQDSEVKA